MRFLRTTAVLLALLLSGYAIWQIQGLHSTVDELRHQIDMVQTLPSEQDQVVIFLVKSTPTDFLLVPVNRTIDQIASPLVALQALIDGPQLNEELHQSVPPTTRVLGLSIFNGLATANFSKELIRDFNGGSQLEAHLVDAIVNTLTEFPEIKEVQILVEGEKVDSIGGHILIEYPLKREV